jgi:hypothetical protein
MYKSEYVKQRGTKKITVKIMDQMFLQNVNVILAGALNKWGELWREHWGPGAQQEMNMSKQQNGSN